MKSKFFTILISPLIAFLLSNLSSTSNPSYSWYAGWLSHHHETMIVDAYGEARTAYMNTGHCDPCWKVSSNHCANMWRTPALANMALSIMFSVFRRN